jgi:hypothetical protein
MNRVSSELSFPMCRDCPVRIKVQALSAHCTGYEPRVAGTRWTDHSTDHEYIAAAAGDVEKQVPPGLSVDWGGLRRTLVHLIWLDANQKTMCQQLVSMRFRHAGCILY